MTAPRIIGEVRSYNELIEAVRKRVAEINAPLDVLEEYIGLTRGHLAKLLGPAEDKRIGMQLLWPLLENLGFVATLKEHLDIDAVRDEIGHRFRERVPYATRGRLKKQMSPALLTAAAQHHGALGRGIPKDFRITKRQLRTKQRKAINARWAKVKATTTYIGKTGGYE